MFFLSYKTIIVLESDSAGTVDTCLGEEAWWDEFSVIFAHYVDLASLTERVSSKQCPR
jgi:hypothetical protein